MSIKNSIQTTEHAISEVEKVLSNATTKLRNSKKGFVHIGSLTDALSQLNVSQYFLIPEEFQSSSNLYSQVKRYTDANPDKKISIEICYAFDVQLKDKPFKLFKVKRIS